jgi:hypothetical protein
MHTKAQLIARTVMQHGGIDIRGVNETVGLEPATVTQVCEFLGITETVTIHEKLWELLGAFEDCALSMIAKLPKNEVGWVEYGGESTSGIFE